MSDSSEHIGPALALHGLAAFDREKEEKLNAASFPTLCQDFESLSVPIRGIVMAVLVSSLLWATIILAGRALWLLFR